MIRLFKIIWDLLGSLKLSLYLLLGSCALFLIGSVYALYNNSLFRRLNEMRIQDWMKENLTSNISVTWWIIIILIVLAILGLNSFVCSCNRIFSIILEREKENYKKIFFSITPSIIHLLFIAVMAGHAVTLTLGSWEKIALEKNRVITIKDMPDLIVASIEDIYYPANSLFNDRIAQTNVNLISKDGKSIVLSHLNNINYGKYILHLEMTRLDDKEKKSENIPGKNIKKSSDKSSTDNLLDMGKKGNPSLEIIRDPGLNIIITAFTLILLLMACYYIGFGKKNSNNTI